jgi:hypothetical protein
MEPDYEQREPPSDRERVKHFLSTYDDYMRLNDALPLVYTIGFDGHAEDEVTRWTVRMHAMILRKYIQKDDRLRLQLVLRSVRACIVIPHFEESEWDWYEGEVEKLETLSELHVGDATYSESEILFKALYGRYLHGDWGKWALTETLDNYYLDHALWLATTSLANKVKDLANIVRGGVKNGNIVLD